MKSLQLKRTNEFVNFFRDYHVYVDGKKIGAISNGQLKKYKIPEESKQLVLKIDWCSSNIFDISSKENPVLLVGSNSFLKKVIIIGCIISAPLLILSFIGIDEKLEHLYLIMIPLLLFFIYFLTFGRKKYLILEKNISDR